MIVHNSHTHHTRAQHARTHLTLWNVMCVCVECDVCVCNAMCVCGMGCDVCDVWNVMCVSEI